MMVQTGQLVLGSSGPTELGTDTGSFIDVIFPTPFPAGSNVVVIPMVQSFNGCNTPGIRIARVSLTGFKIRMNELVVNNPNATALSDGPHVDETVGWIAFTV